MQKEVGFFAYFSTIKQGSKEKLSKILIIQMLYGAAFGVVFGITNNFAVLLIMLGFLAFFASVPQQWIRSVKPNLTSLVPLSQRRRTVYNILSIPAMFVFSIIICGVMFFGIWLLSGLGAAAVMGDAAVALSIMQLYLDGMSHSFEDSYAVLLFLSMLIFVMGAGTIYSHTDNKKYRNLTAITLFAVALIGSEVLLQTALRYAGETSEIHVAGYAGMYIKYLPLPWLAVALCALVSLCVLAFGLYLAIQKNKPKNY